MTTDAYDHQSDNPTTDPTDSAHTGAGKGNISDSLRGPAEAIKEAGTSAFGVIKEFADHFRDDRQAKFAASEKAHGAHAADSAETADTAAPADVSVDASNAAADTTESAAGFSAAGTAAGANAGTAAGQHAKESSLFNRATEMFKDVSDSVRRAADQTKESPRFGEAKDKFSKAYSSTREGVNEAVTTAKERRNAAKANKATKSAADMPSATGGDESSHKTQSDIIEGEIVSTVETTEPTNPNNTQGQ